MGFDGLVVSDCGTISMIYQRHKWQTEGWGRAVNAQEATVLSIQAGTDLNCGQTYVDYGKQSVEEGLLSEDKIDRALLRAFTQRMKTVKS